MHLFPLIFPTSDTSESLDSLAVSEQQNSLQKKRGNLHGCKVIMMLK